MKLSTSTSSSHAPLPPSSSTTTMCNSKNSTPGCFTVILRKILCSSCLPKDPSDQIRELDSSNSMGSEKDQNLKAKQNAEAEAGAGAAATTTTPGIVARLMGLESTPVSFSRSRSMNSVDCLGECNRMQDLHKRVKSTLSFRELPTFLLIENDNFLVLSFENGGENRAFKSNGGKRERGCVELKQKMATERGELKEDKREKVCDKKNLSKKGKLRNNRVSDMSCGNIGSDVKLQEITNTSHQFKASSKKKCFDSEGVKLAHPMNRKEAVISEKKRRRKKKTNCYTENKMEIECKSEDSSPVSVLDFEREASGTVGLSSRRKLSPELENDQHFPLRSDGNLMIDERKDKEVKNNKYEGSKKKEKHSKEYIDIWNEVCKLVEGELAESYQFHAWINKQCDLESISADFESEILDLLLNELMDQLVEHPLTSL